MDKVRRKLQSLIPAKLKYRLLAAFILVILVPYALLQIWNYTEIENVIRRQVGVQNQAQVDNLASEFEMIRSTLFLSAIQMEKDETVWRLLKEPSPERRSNEEQANGIFSAILSRFPKTNGYVDLLITDLHSNVYTSYPARSSYKAEDVAQEPGFRGLGKSPGGYAWLLHSYSDLNKVDGDEGRQVVSVYMLLHGPDGEPVGKLRFTMEIESWLRTSIRTFPILQDYYLLDRAGNTVYQTASRNLQMNDMDRLTRSGGTINETDSSVLNAARIQTMDWLIVSKFPLNIFFGDLAGLKQRFLVSFVMITAIFIAITFFILSTITRPLNQLQRKMKETVRRNLNVQIPEEPLQGEVLSLAQTFNQMIRDMEEMVRRLKTEERQKEAVRFQMLLSQMNPHFLLNTLNTMKWTAHEGDAAAVEEMCVSLCLLLESSLRSDVELIYLKDEIGLLEAYLYIQNVRFDGKFEVFYELADGLDYALVPKLSLQPLAENAIQHGLAPRSGKGSLTVRAVAPGANLILCVEDNGVGMEQAAKASAARKRKGIGLSNLKERLELLFRERGKLEAGSDGEGTRVTISLPLLLSNPVNQGGVPHVEGSVGRG